MTKYLDILKVGARALDLSSELEALQAIETVARRWAELSPRLDGFTSVIDFIARVDEEIDREDVKAAFAALGLEQTLESLTKLRTKISSVLETIGLSHAERLVHPLSRHPESEFSENTGAVSWSLIDAGDADASAGESADFDFDLGGKAELVLEGGSLWPYSLEAPRERMVRIGAAGKLSAKGAGKVPFSFGSAGLSIGGDGEASLDYYFEPSDQNQLLCSAVATRLAHVPSPFDIAAVRRAMNSASDFFGYDLVLGGGVTAQVDVALGKSFEIPAVGSAAIALTFKATLIRKRKFQISLRRLGAPNAIDPDLRLVVSGQKNRRDEHSLGIKISLDFGKLADHIHEQLEPIVKEWDDGLAAITPYLKPGTYLQGKAGSLFDGVIGDLLGDTKIAAAIKADMALLLGTATADSTAIGDFLADQLKGALDGLVSAGFGEIDEQAGLLLAALKARLPLFESLDKDDAVLGELRKLIAAFKDDLSGTIGAVTDTKPKRQKIAKILSRVGADANRVVANVDDALAGIRKLIAAYDGTVKKALEMLTKAANRQVSLTITYAQVKSDDTTIELNAKLFAGVSQPTFDTLLSGNFADLAKLVLDPGQHVLFDEGTALKRVVTHTQTSGGAFIGFGVKADFKTVFTGKAEIALDHRGNVTVLSKGLAQDISTTAFGDKETTEATFFDSISIARAIDAERTPAKPGILDLGLNMRRKDGKGLKLNELQKLIDDMQRFSLLTAQGARDAAETVKSWIDAGGSRPVPAVIDVALPLTGQQMMQVLEANPEQTMRVAVDALIDTATGAPDVKLKHHTNGLEAALKLLRMQSGTDLEIMMALGRKEWSESWAKQEIAGSVTIGSGSSGRMSDFLLLHERVMAGWHLIKLAEELHKLSSDLPIVAGNPEAWNFDEFAKAQKRVMGRTKDWLATGQKFIVFGTDGIDRRMAAFFIALGGMAGLSEEQVRQTVTLSIQHTGDVNKLIVVS
ncbi:hypothetical protein [Erythrobacter colymbi]|uniref:hypothetical protein n=1 Tax=Erythrobacter colymbi TaxID=1161202 RepID=UPI000A371A36|nr:hypothetical protein [Erythrobacter colymbi]